MRVPTTLAAAALLLGSAAAAHAVTFGVVRIDIVQNANSAWHLAEVQAFESGTGINKALAANGGVASYPTGIDGGANDTAGDTSGSTFGTIPLDANDGNTNGNFGGGSVWHSDDPTAVGDTFRITLGAPSDIATLSLFGRTDCCQDRDNNLSIRLFDVGGNLLFSTNAGIPDNQTLNITTPTLPEPVTGSLLLLAGAALLRRRNRTIA